MSCRYSPWRNHELLQTKILRQPGSSDLQLKDALCRTIRNIHCLIFYTGTISKKSTRLLSQVPQDAYRSLALTFLDIKSPRTPRPSVAGSAKKWLIYIKRPRNHPMHPWRSCRRTLAHKLAPSLIKYSITSLLVETYFSMPASFFHLFPTWSLLLIFGFQTSRNFSSL